MIGSTLSILQSKTNRMLPLIALLIGLMVKASINQFAVKHLGMGSLFDYFLAVDCSIINEQSNAEKNLD